MYLVTGSVTIFVGLNQKFIALTLTFIFRLEGSASVGDWSIALLAVKEVRTACCLSLS